MLAKARLEAREVVHRVDIVGEIRDLDGARARVRAKALGAARAVERREVLGRRETQRVGRPIRRSDEGRRRVDELEEIGSGDARQVRVDDDDGPADVGQRSRDGRTLPSAQRRDSRLPDVATRNEHVGEHRRREGGAHFAGEIQPRLAAGACARYDDRDHAGKPTQERDTDGVRIAATQKFPGPAWDELDVELLDPWPPPEPQKGVDALAVAVTRIGADELELFPDLRLVANYGVGYDLVDVEECRRRGIAVTNTPGVLDAAVADLTLALILATRRNIVTADRWIREGGWQNNWARPKLLGRDLAGARLGLVGFGRIGREVARRAEVFGMEVAFNTRSAGVGLDELLASSDVISLHLPLTEETRGVISRERLALIQDGATLINTARGAVVDEEALIDELVSGRISAGLDVFATEPAVPDALFGLPNVVLTPHIASATAETRAAMTRVLVDNVLAYSRGEPLVTPVTVS